jgi:DNA polymerase-3 subunit gamma/tau
MPRAMSYTVLARRYRSSTFDELIGQNHIAQTLSNAITSNRIAHAFLFTGTRGTGKTSSARILAKSLNCEASDKPTPHPCGKCNSCQAIARGDDIDVIEIDAASNTGVDNVREIIENAQFRPARSRFKVYIVDEVHMLSKSAFNALLKTLEEPPEHVKFILATTEVEKVLPTILSRCQRYDFRNIPTREIAQHLRKICEQEKISADEDAILLVAKAGAGSMRDALSLLDRLLSASGDQLTTGTIEQLLGLPKSQQIFDIAQQIGSGDVKSVLVSVDSIITRGLSPETLASSLIDHFRNLLILRTCGKNSELVEVPGLPLEEIFQQAQAFDPVVLSQNIVVLEELRRQLRSASAGRALIDATMVRLALAGQFSTVEDLLAAASDGAGIEKKKYEPDGGLGLEASGLVKSTPEVAAAPAPSAPSPQSLSPKPEALDIDPVSSSDENDDLPAVGRVWEGAGPVSVFAAFKKASATQPAPAATLARSTRSDNLGPVDRTDFAGLMDRLHAAASEQSPTAATFLEGGKIISVAPGNITVEYPKNLAASARMLDRNGKRESLQQVLSDLLGEPTGIKLEVSDVEVIEEKPPTPERRVHRPAPASSPQAESAPVNQGLPLTDELRTEILQNNPLIKSIAEAFNARVVKVE